MFKKAIVGSVAVVMLVGLVAFGGRPFSYARTWVASWKQSAEENVPLDLKIKHAREEVTKLGPDIRKCMHTIAQQQVDVEHLQKQITNRQADVKKQEAAIHTLRNDLKRGDETYVYAGHAYKSSEVRRDLAVRFDRFRIAEESLKRDQTILEARKKSLVANEKRLEEMLEAKKQLEVQVEQLEARWKTLQAAQVSSDLEFDDSHLSRTKTLMRQLDKELDVLDRTLAADTKLSGTIPVDEKPSEIPLVDVTNQVDSYFAKRNGKSVVNNNATPAAKPAISGL